MVVRRFQNARMRLIFDDSCINKKIKSREHLVGGGVPHASRRDAAHEGERSAEGGVEAVCGVVACGAHEAGRARGVNRHSEEDCCGGNAQRCRQRQCAERSSHANSWSDGLKRGELDDRAHGTAR